MRKLWLLLVMVLVTACGGGSSGGPTTQNGQGVGTGVLTVDISAGAAANAMAKSIAALPQPQAVRVVVTQPAANPAFTPVIQDVTLGTSPSITLPVGTGYHVEVITFAVEGSVNRVLKYGAADNNGSGGYTIQDGQNTAIAITTVTAITPPAITLPVDANTPNGGNGLFAGDAYAITNPSGITTPLQQNWYVKLQTTDFTSYPHIDSSTIPTTHTAEAMPSATSAGTVYALGEFYLSASYLKAGESATSWVASSVATTTKPLYVHGGGITGTIFADTYPPAVTSFAVPATVYSTTAVNVTIGATDNVSVAKYLVTESAAAATAPADVPASGDARWAAASTSSSFSYTFAAPLTSGASTKLWAWARDPSGNVSAATDAALARTVTCSTIPHVLTFSVPSGILTSGSGTIPVTLTATSTAGGGITGYLINTSATPPDPADLNWSATSPTSYAYSASIVHGKTSYLPIFAWVKDANGVSASLQHTLNINDSPTVTTFTATAQTSPSATADVTIAATSYATPTTLSYLVTETSTRPSASDPGWAATVSSHTFASRPAAGTRVVLYAWVKDSNGTISAYKATYVQY